MPARLVRRPHQRSDHAANQLRLWFASFAYVLMGALRRIGPAHNWLAAATCGTIRLKLLKIGARVRVSVHRVKVAMASACPYADDFTLAYARIRTVGQGGKSAGNCRHWQPVRSR